MSRKRNKPSHPLWQWNVINFRIVNSIIQFTNNPRLIKRLVLARFLLARIPPPPLPSAIKIPPPSLIPGAIYKLRIIFSFLFGSGFLILRSFSSPSPNLSALCSPTQRVRKNLLTSLSIFFGFHWIQIRKEFISVLHALKRNVSCRKNKRQLKLKREKTK